MSDAAVRSAVRAMPAAAWALALAAAIGVVFVALGITAPLWFDEANYLSLADAIGRTGYPLWLWKPDQPELFQDSPPGLIYALQWVSAAVGRNVVALRLVHAVAFGAIPWVVLIVFARRRGVPLASVAIAALFATTIGIWLLELVQIRLDLPIAGLSALALVAAAAWIERADRRGWWLFLAVAVFSAAAFLTKYEAICLTGALVLAAAADAIWLRSRRSVSVLAAHLAGLAVAVVILAAWAASYRALNTHGAPVVDAMQSNVFGRIFPDLNDIGHELDEFRWTIKTTLNIAALPFAALIIAAARGRIDWRGDALLRLCTLFSIVVVGFNVVVYRMPGAGDYYLAEAVIPLGYLLGRSLEALVPSARALGAVAALMLVISFGLNGPTFLPSHLPRQEEAVAATLAPVLAETDVLLLGDTSQSRAIPYLLGRSDRYAYLFHIDPAEVPDLLARRGPGQVGAIVLSPHAMGRLRAPTASATKAALDENFRTSGPLTPDGLTVYFRR